MLAVIRGAGDLASAIALRLVRSGMQVAMTEIERPLTVRRTVAFSEAVRLGRTTVEGVEARLVRDAREATEVLEQAEVIPVLVDPECRCIAELSPDVVVDAILAKRNLGTAADMAPVVIGVGPGFTAGVDCHAVVESMRGHTLGRAYYEGSALPNTAIPGLVGGFAGERVLRATADGLFRGVAAIGDHVEAGQVVAYSGHGEVVAMISGTLRGLVADGVYVTRGLKCGDVDARGDASYCDLVSDKGLAIAGGVLEAILHLSGALAVSTKAGSPVESGELAGAESVASVADSAGLEGTTNDGSPAGLKGLTRVDSFHQAENPTKAGER